MKAITTSGATMRRIVGPVGWLCVAALVATPACARPAFSCAGFALLGGAQLVCSHVDPEAPPQTCNFSWSLLSGNGQSIVTGAFVLAPGVTNATVFQGTGYTATLANPVVLCQAAQYNPEP